MTLDVLFLLCSILLSCCTIDMPMDWCIEKVTTLLMWSGSEVAQAVLGNRALNTKMSSELNMFVYALAHVCAKQDREENDSQHLRCVSVCMRWILVGRIE